MEILGHERRRRWRVEEKLAIVWKIEDEVRGKNADNQIVSISTQLSNQIRGLMKTFGLIVPPQEQVGCLTAM